jgi:3-carboxy-cis,cis-muconate cycloisomerase
VTGILDATFARGPVSAGGPAADPWLVALLEVEGALARAAARVGLVAENAA